jgi:accessory gene regulator B
MISRLAKSTACFFVDNKIIEAEDEEVYSYGMELLLSTAVNLAVAIIIAMITKSFLPCLVNLTAFLTLRVNAGGYHADTHLGCTMTLISTLLIFIFAEKNIPEAAMFYNSLIMLMFSNILIIMLSPVEHPNKPLNDELRKKLRNKSVLWAGIWTVFCIVFIIIDISICFYAASGVFTIALAMIAEKFKLKEKVR